jgi:hypothetical protein
MFGKKSKNQKLLIHVKDNPTDYTVTRPIEKSSDGKSAYVIIEPETENKSGWKVDITDRVRLLNGVPYVEVVRGSTRAVEIKIENSMIKNEPMTSDEYQQLINLKIFKAHYGKLLGDLLSALKPYLIVLVVVVIIAVALSGYNAYAISKLPENIHLVYPTPTPQGIITG